MSKKERKQADEDLDKLFEQAVPKATFDPAIVPVYVISASVAVLAGGCT